MLKMQKNNWAVPYDMWPEKSKISLVSYAVISIYICC